MLVGLANRARLDGTGAFPWVATLVPYTGLSGRTVRTCLDRLQPAGIISLCDPDIVAARIKRADRRPQGWDLNFGMVHDDDFTVYSITSSGIAARLVTAAQPGTDDHADGVQLSHSAL